MSVSLTLIPVVLILRMAMGNKKFDTWVRSTQVKMPSIFKNEIELCKCLQLAGYDAVQYGSLIKTHLDSDNYFFWEKIKGVWTAVFTQYDSQQAIAELISRMEMQAGKRVLYPSLQEMKGKVEKPRAKEQIPPLPKPEKETFPTNFADKDLLIRTLREYGVHPRELSNGDIQCKVDDCILVFHKEGESSYEVEVKGAASLQGVYHSLAALDEDYRRIVQEYTYKNVVQKLQKSDMKIESEEILDDNSILLTINI